MIWLQEIIHKFEEGEGARWIKIGAGLLGLVALIVLYDLREYKNFSSQEAMDAAQLARNLAEGRGFTTDFIRPLSLQLMRQHSDTGDMGLKGPHPDLFNAPLYPLVLAAFMKVAPMNYEIGEGTLFLRYQPEVYIAFLNQGLFLLAGWLLFRLVRRWFDREVAWMSLILFFGAEIFWQFSVSGLSTMLLLVLVLSLVDGLTRIEAELREERLSERRLWGWVLAAGVLLGLAILARYSMIALAAAAVAFALLYGGPRRLRIAAALAATAFLVVAPWLARNHSVCGRIWGGATFALDDHVGVFQNVTVERSMTPEVAGGGAELYARKLLVNLGDLLRQDFPQLGGSWVAAFFLVGLMVPFRSPALNRMRVFLLLALAALAAAQALGKTHLSTEAPVVNSENLLVLLAPFVFAYGAGLFFVLLDQLTFPSPPYRLLTAGAFALITCAPLALRLLPPRSFPLAYPPYYPPWVQMVSGWMKQGELMMSDIPWAVAWYGRKTCVGTVLDADKDFYAINDYQKAVLGLYLTQRTTDAKFYSRMVQPAEKGWEWFILQSVVKTNIPAGFPLKVGVPGFLQQGQLFLTDRERWLTAKND